MAHTFLKSLGSGATDVGEFLELTLAGVLVVLLCLDLGLPSTWRC